MIARIFAQANSWLHRKPADNTDAEYIEAFAAYRRALQRGDTRTQGEAWTRLCKAQIARLKAEVPCRGIGWRGAR